MDRLDWRFGPRQGKGVKCVINCDASGRTCRFIGAGQHREKGWLTKAGVINTWPLEQLKKEWAGKRDRKRWTCSRIGI